MPPQTRARSDASASKVYKPTPAAPKQVRFPSRQTRIIRTYGRTAQRKGRQSTLTQMDFVSSTAPEPELTFSSDEGSEDGADDQAGTKPRKSGRSGGGKRRRTLGDEEAEPPRPRGEKRRRTLGDASSASQRTITQLLSHHGSKDEEEPETFQVEDRTDEEGDLVLVDENEEPSKDDGQVHATTESRTGGAPQPPPAPQSQTPKNRRTRTMEIPSSESPVTPMLLKYSPAGQISPLKARSTRASASQSQILPVAETPKSRQIRTSEVPPSESPPTPMLLKYSPAKQISPLKARSTRASASQSQILPNAETPKSRQIRTSEVPPSESPATPMLQKYSPAKQVSPLIQKSTNTTALTPSVKSVQKTPRNLVIQDSYSTSHSSPTTPTPKSRGQASSVGKTSGKILRFDLPENKENVTPGRKRAKSPRPVVVKAERQPLGEVLGQVQGEVPDSDEDLDVTDIEEVETDVGDAETDLGDVETDVGEAETDIGETENDFGEANTDLGEADTDHDENELQPDESAAHDNAPGHGEVTIIPDDDEEDVGEVNTNHDEGEEAVAQADMLGEDDTTLIPDDDDEESHYAVGAETQAVLISSGRASRVLGARSSPHASQQGLAGEEETTPRAETHRYTEAYTQAETQGLESQRVPLAAINATGPINDRSDIVISIYGDHVDKMLARTKNHEFRSWRIPDQVHRVWIYMTRPQSVLKYMCIFGPAKTPGEIDEDGIGNADFNKGCKSKAKFAYEVLQMFELNNPVPLDVMKQRGWPAAPQTFAYVPPVIVGQLTANLRCSVFEEQDEEEDQQQQQQQQQQQLLPSSSSFRVTESQELEQQIRSDISHSTQMAAAASEQDDEIIPASQSPPTASASRRRKPSQGHVFQRPALPQSQSGSSAHALPALHHHASLHSSQRAANPVRPSQATTVSQVSSSSPALPSPQKAAAPVPALLSSSQDANENTDADAELPALSSSRDADADAPIPCSVPSSPSTRHSLRSSQFPTKSQMLPEGMLDESIREPPPIVWDSADEMSD